MNFPSNFGLKFVRAVCSGKRRDEQYTTWLSSTYSRTSVAAGYLTHSRVVSRYTRNLLHSAKCGCPGLPSSSSASVNIPSSGHRTGHLLPPHPPHWRHGGPGHPHHQLGQGAPRGQGVLLYSSETAARPSKHLTVNPLMSPPTMPAISSAAHRRLVPSIKQTASERSSDNSIPSADYEINHTDPDEKTGNETAEPIYAEIRAKEIKDDQHQPLKSSPESESKQNKSEQNEQHQELSGKKEIEYWQITAKEVVKFRPCTETFIVRE